MKSATTLTRTGPIAINLDAEVEPIEPEEKEDVTIIHDGRRTSISGDSRFLPLHMVRVRPTKK